MESIRQQGFALDNCMVSYWSEAEGVQVFAGVHPIKQDQKIAVSELNAQQVIQIKLRPQSGVLQGQRGSKRSFKSLGSLPDDAPVARTA